MSDVSEGSPSTSTSQDQQQSKLGEHSLSETAEELQLSLEEVIAQIIIGTLFLCSDLWLK